MSLKQLALKGIMLFAATAWLIPSAHALQSGGEVYPEGQIPRIQSQIDFAQGQMSRYSRQRAQLEEDLAEFQSELFGVESKREQRLQEQFANGVSNESFADIMRSLQLQRVELSIDLAGLDARRKSLQAIAETSPAATVQAAIQTKLQQQVEILKQSLEFAKTRYENGNGPESEMYAAQRNLLTAEIRLLEFQQVESSDAGSIELRDVALERAEKRARLEKVDEILGQLAIARGQIEEVVKLDRQGEMWRDKIETGKQAIREVDRKIDVARQDLEGYLKIQEEQAAEDQ